MAGFPQTLCAEQVVSVATYGVTGNGVTDDTAALRVAVATAIAADLELYAPPDFNILITDTVDMQLCRRVRIEGTITVAETVDPGVIAGYTSAQRKQNPDLYFGRVVYAGSQTNVALRLVGLKDAHAYIGYCDYLQLYADSAIADKTSISYSKFEFGNLQKLELYGEAGVSWINSNKFYGGDIKNLIINAVTYNHNDNEFRCAVEGSATLDCTTGAQNRFFVRGEGAVTVTFGSTSYKNRIMTGTDSNPGTRAVTLVVTDSGRENLWVSVSDQGTVQRTVARVDAFTVAYNGSNEFFLNGATIGFLPGLYKLKKNSTFRNMIDTGIMRISSSSPAGENGYRCTRFSVRSDVALLRPIVSVYDSNRVQLDASAGSYMDTIGGWITSGLNYTFSGDVSAARIVIIDSTVKFVRIQVQGGSTASGTAFEYAELCAFVPLNVTDSVLDIMRRACRRPVSQAAVPTQGTAYVGQQIINSAGGAFTCTARNATALSVAAIATDITITVTSAAGMATGDLIGVLLDDGTTHWTTINGAPVANVITLTVAMPSAAAIGNNVVANRWV